MASLDTNPYQFLQYQKNSFLYMQEVRNHQYDPAYSQRPLLYRKPEEICKQPGQELPLFWRDKLSFSREWRGQINSYVQSFGLELKLICDQDIPAVKDFLARRYPEEMAKEICAFDLHRFRQYGHGLVLQDRSGRVKGSIFEIGYDTVEKTSYTVRLAVDETHEGQNLGYHLMMYSSLLAMEQGSRVKRGLIQFHNTRSLYINLNKVGWICDGFDPNITSLGAFFHISMPLDPTGLTSNAIDLKKLERFIATKQNEKDYLILEAEDLEGVSCMYADTPFKVVAVLPPGMTHPSGSFFALSSDRIQLDERFRPYDKASH